MPDAFMFVHDNDGGYDVYRMDYTGMSKEPVDNSELGDCFHVAFFYTDENGNSVFDESFEAIFIDPMTYIKTLVGSKYYGLLARKTEDSTKWFENSIKLIMGAKNDKAKA